MFLEEGSPSELKSQDSLKEHSVSEASVDEDETNCIPFNMYSDAVKRRIGAARKLHFEYEKLHEKYLAEVSELKRKYEELFRATYDKRQQIIDGVYEPKDEDIANPESLGATEPSLPPSESHAKGFISFIY